MPRPFEDIPRDAWDRLYAQSACATPFSRWTFHRAWWDAYGATAHEQYFVVPATVDHVSTAADGPPEQPLRAIIPLMHRHEIEPDDQRTATVLRRGVRHGTRLPGDAKAIFFGASYHADYATLLCDEADLPEVADALVDALAGPPDTSHGRQPWDVVDLRRLRRADPALRALDDAFRSRAAIGAWSVTREREDVCPVLVVRPDAGWDEYLAGLSKKARHEIRRKLRRAQAAGPLRIDIRPPSAEAVEAFIGLHRKRFAGEGLFPDSEGGERSRHFVLRLAELESAEADGGQLSVAEVRSGERLIFSALVFDDGRTCYLYNAGMDPDASELSPGITGTAEYLRDRMEAGRGRFDFMRGNESYKYAWGARDEPIDRLIVLRQEVA